ncbi:hypothetical protein EJ02DRAFT_451099 [Clathrospora elynae]|uniref:Uncharacterized protein n=1 Tax=Clathrospora elynae TaxID=706981 RepID=A0A6A5T253_9PLEO|nr:hypothetical protein EJ02DRAFT_451099 [Clathrospora elynae]
MSAPTPLQRSSWKAEAIRRGDLKISGPMPITEDMPLNEEEEKEFAETGGLNSPLQPQDALEEQIQRPETPPRQLQSAPSIPEHLTALRSNPVEVPQQQGEALPERQLSRSPPKMRLVNDVQRESVVQPTSLTSPTPFVSTPETTSKAAQKKKRSSGIRNVFRKMFGRKGRDGGEDHGDEAAPRGHSYHHSESDMLQQSSPREPRTPTGPRISELPVKELQPLHPLGQHLPYPMNVNAPPASPPQEYLTFDMQRPDIGRRRATLPSIPSASIHRLSLDEQRAKLSTWEEKQEDDAIPSPGIGIALSSPAQSTTPRQSRRRSRSADALLDIVKGRTSTERRRSADIRYWRESYISGSIYSRPQTAKTVETIRSVQAQEPTIQATEMGSFNEMSATLVQADESETPTPVLEQHHPELEREIVPPDSAFNFGNLKSAALESEESAPESLREEAPPSVPPFRSLNRLSMEDRVQHLENKFDNLETLTHRMSSRNNRQTIVLEHAPRNLRSRNRSSSTRRSVSRSAPSIHQEPIHHPSSDTLDPGVSPTFAPSVPSNDNGDEGARALRNVYEALGHERGARKTLEQQVRSLQHDVSDLHALVNKLIVSATATSPNYPTPSPDALIVSTEDGRMATPRAAAHDRGRGYRMGEVKEGERWKSDASSGSEFEEELREKKSYDDVATPDVWATPKEEGFGEYEFFHGEGERMRGYV